MPRLSSVFVWLIGLLTATTLCAEDTVDFIRDVRPIFVNRCYRCHSSLKQESNLRLDSGDAIRKGGDGGVIVVPTKNGDSRLLQAVLRVGELKMPPEGEPLSAAQVALLKKWIDQGAPAPAGNDPIKHWSFVPPQRPTVPVAVQSGRSTNAIDAFVEAHYAEQKLTPVGPAPKHVLLRRVYLDLIGLPPSADEVRVFVADDTPDAYERVVDRLLANPAYGERWGRHWMDVWRYSDWDGYGAEIRESQPHIWRWRDWIIESLNADKPYDRMIVEMLAGDELAPEDPATLRATGYLARSWYKFNRNVWLDQALEHTGKAFLGVTFNCARCHDHMYDPLPQLDYYQLRAFFEPYDVRTDRVPGQPDATKDGLARVFDRDLAAPTFVFVRGDEKQPNKDQPLAPAVPKAIGGDKLKLEPITLGPQAYYPGLQAYVHEESFSTAKAEVTKAEAALAAAQQALAGAKQKLAEFVAAKPATTPAPEPAKPQVNVFLADSFAAAKPELWTFGAGKWEYKEGKLCQTGDSDGASVIVSQKPHPRDFVATFRFQPTGGKMWKSVGMSFDALEDSDRASVYLSAFAGGPKVQISTRVNGQDIYPPEAAKPLPVELGKVYELQVAVREQLVNVWVDGQIQVAYRLPSPRTKDGRFQLWTFDATGEFHSIHVAELSKEIPLVLNAATGQPAPPASPETALTWALKQAAAAVTLAQSTLATTQAAVVSVAARIAADQANYSLPPVANAKDLSLAAGQAERELALQQAEHTLFEAQQKLELTKTSIKPDDEKTKKAASDAEANVAKLAKARDDAKAAAVQPNENYTRFSGVHPTTSTGRRLALANWIASAANPLTARVAVNHIWLRHFGNPLVPTVFDFGLNGKPPTHPELLDWLAVEFLGIADCGLRIADSISPIPHSAFRIPQSSWSTKRMHRLMVTSATYRLSSTGRGGDEANQAIDPENRHLWRMTARRMEAELVRDATLHIAGSLDRALSGPDLDPNAGLTLARRSIYFRSSKEKKMTFLSLFDSANPVECYRRSESVAPQQALAMANSPLTLAQARLLARSLTAATGDAKSETVTPFLQAAFEQILGRPASRDELVECERFVAEQTQRFADPKSLTAFAGGADSAVKPAADPHLRARENLVHVLLNHNDFVTIR